MIFLDKWFAFKQNKINEKNKKKLKNKTMSIISSNCAGGFLYHWLGLRFNSPFINLFLTNDDFLTAMENFDEFISFNIVEDTNSGKPYPVGIGYKGTRINFMHYSTFDEAIQKWNQRVSRIDKDNIFVMLTNWNGDDSIVKRFEKLPFSNKIIFVNKEFSGCSSSFCIRKWQPVKNGKPNNIWRTANLFTGKRFIDYFDYISFFNNK